MTFLLIVLLIILLFCTPETAGTVIGSLVLAVIWIISVGILVLIGFLAVMALVAVL